jgi:hypothetical protein
MTGLSAAMTAFAFDPLSVSLRVSSASRCRRFLMAAFDGLISSLGPG